MNPALSMLLVLVCVASILVWSLVLDVTGTCEPYDIVHPGDDTDDGR